MSPSKYVPTRTLAKNVNIPPKDHTDQAERSASFNYANKSMPHVPARLHDSSWAAGAIQPKAGQEFKARHSACSRLLYSVCMILATSKFHFSTGFEILGMKKNHTFLESNFVKTGLSNLKA